jgi:16S rRNA (guanine527-N7)-methyltransferase
VADEAPAGPYGFSDITWPEAVTQAARLNLDAVLGEARQWGFLGPGPVAQHVAHSLALLPLCLSLEGISLDLGSGGGVPGLVLATAAPESQWILLDAQQRRTAFLSAAVSRLGLRDRVAVRCERAEETGRGPIRATVSLVVARGFSAPAPTAECAAPLLRQGGHLLVTEPPGAPDRWSSPPLLQLGLVEDAVCTAPIAARRFVQQTLCPKDFPRRNGLPRKRPLFS